MTLELDDSSSGLITGELKISGAIRNVATQIVKIGRVNRPFWGGAGAGALVITK